MDEWKRWWFFLLHSRTLFLLFTLLLLLLPCNFILDPPKRVLPVAGRGELSFLATQLMNHDVVSPFFSSLSLFDGAILLQACAEMTLTSLELRDKK